jgi:hypothetical protein
MTNTRTVMPDTNHDGMWFATSADMNGQLTSRLQLHVHAPQ